jgi:hypothetical protein
MEVRRNNRHSTVSAETEKTSLLLFKEIAMNSKSIVVAALFSALTLPVFAQTGAPAAPATAKPAAATPAAATATPKAEHAAKHKTVKHTKKEAKAEKTTTTPAATPATPATPAAPAAPAKAK